MGDNERGEKREKQRGEIFYYLYYSASPNYDLEIIFRR
jgi:hypothetical protein